MMSFGLDYEATAWMSEGICAQIDTEHFFPELGQTSTVARKICGGCPVRVKCLNYALDEEIRDGIWGGTTGKQRYALRRQGRAA